jgi:hypothetical protein
MALNLAGEHELNDVAEKTAGASIGARNKPNLVP